MFSAEQARARYVKKPAAQQRQTTTAVGAKATPAKPAPARASSTGGKGTATGKHGQATSKHQPKKARQFTPDGDVALCSARAVAESLRLALGVAVGDVDVLAWYWATASDPEQGQTILEAFSAANAALGRGDLLIWPTQGRAAILGLDLPDGNTHAVAVGPDGTWWSWGQPWQPPAGTVIDEAWAVSWS